MSQRTSVPRILQPLQNAIHRASVSREMGDSFDASGMNDTLDVEQGLDSIPEIDEPPLVDDEYILPASSRRGKFSVGGFLGRLVHLIWRMTMAVVAMIFRALSAVMLTLGWTLGSIYDVTLKRPMDFLGGSHSKASVLMTKYFVTALGLYLAWYFLRNPLSALVPSRGHADYDYHAPSIPASDLSELSARLQRLETAFSGIAADSIRDRGRLEGESRGREALTGRLTSLEAKVSQEASRSGQAEEQARKWERDGLGEVRREIQALQAQVAAAAHRAPGIGSDEQARTRLKELEERLGGVEGGVKEALEASKHAVKVDDKAGAAWWRKLAASSASGGQAAPALTIKSSDGQDVTRLIGHLVDGAVSRYSKDMLARQDFALYSGGAGVIPQLTSATYEIRPAGVRGSVVGWLTGRGFAVGRPPVTALHHELQVGHCWPFRGQQGQLGIQLSAPVFVQEVTIDHAAREVAFDMRSAPREMELWGLVEGAENVERYEAWRAERAREREERRVEAELAGEEAGVQEDAEDVAIPESLSAASGAPWVRVARMVYDAHAAQNVQTFAADEAYARLGVDVGLVALRIESNWGQDDFTCLYRVRVHGEALRPAPAPLPALEDDLP
jgi:SUN domain-containing protein 1/2